MLENYDMLWNVIDIKTYGSEVCGHETNNCTAQKKCGANTVSYLRVGPVLQFLPELCNYSHRICTTYREP